MHKAKQTNARHAPADSFSCHSRAYTTATRFQLHSTALNCRILPQLLVQIWRRFRVHDAKQTTSRCLALGLGPISLLPLRPKLSACHSRPSAIAMFTIKPIQSSSRILSIVFSAQTVFGSPLETLPVSQDRICHHSALLTHSLQTSA